MSIMGNTVPRNLCWSARATGCADAMRAMAMQVLHLLTGNKATGRDQSSDEVRMLEVHACIEYGDLDALAGILAVKNACRYQAPSSIRGSRNRIRAGKCEEFGLNAENRWRRFDHVTAQSAYRHTGGGQNGRACFLE